MTTIGSLELKTELANTSFSSVKPQLQHESTSPCRQTAPPSTNRSVKSIVAWLESSSASQQPWSPRTTVADMPHDLSISSISTCHRHTSPKERVSAASDVEDYSLTYLKYQDYFAGAPLGRCLDQTPKNDLPSARICLAGTGEAAPVSTQRTGADGSGRAVVGRDCLDEKHVRGSETTACPEFMERDPDEVRAF
ncbi:hypothetical protein E4U21_003396 [Claviceps maximensis]|nr:hypothetical protein E4U21_003396 [Claviceps maximensis]